MSSETEQMKIAAVKSGMGAFQELARRGGMHLAKPQGVAQFGALAVSGAAFVAPGAVAAASAAAVVAAPVVAIAGVGYLGFKLVKWIADEW